MRMCASVRSGSSFGARELASLSRTDTQAIRSSQELTNAQIRHARLTHRQRQLALHAICALHKLNFSPHARIRIAH